MTVAGATSDETVTRRRAWKWVRVLATAAVLAGLAWWLGAGPFLDGLRAVDGLALAAPVGLAALSIVCSAWRWKVVARGLGSDLPIGSAVASYYRSVFLNVTLPGGVVGDVHRGISHGRESGDVGRGLRAVVWERAAGQIVQAIMTLGVLLLLASPVRPAMPLVVIAIVVAVGVGLLLAKAFPGRGQSWTARLRTAAGRDVRDGLLGGGAWPVIAFTSVVVVACQVATFMIAAKSTGLTAPISTMLPLTFLVLAAMVLPNVGGWGPREGVAAWVFAAAGLGAEQGVATAVAFGVMVFVASLPGAVILAAGWIRSTRRAGGPPRSNHLTTVIRSEGAPDA